MIEIVYRQEKDRWVRGDRFLRPFIRTLIRGNRSQYSGMERVVINFLKGLEQKGIEYSFNKPTFLLKKSEPIISFGLGRSGVYGIHRDIPIIAAIGFPYPSDFPELCKKYNVKKFLVHSQWILDFVKSANLYDEKIFDLWPAGIDTQEWFCSRSNGNIKFDVLIYNKIHWSREERQKDLVCPIHNFLSARGFSFTEIGYGNYKVEDYKQKLSQSKVMLFLAEHESQGLACQECMSCDVPVIAWDQGYYLDPDRFTYGLSVVKATSVPFFDQRCGVTFKNAVDFQGKFQEFYDNARAGHFKPRDYVLENVSIEKSTNRMLEIYESI